MKNVEIEIREIFDRVEVLLTKKEKDLFWVLRYRTLNAQIGAKILGIPRTTFLYRKEKLFITLRNLILKEFGEEVVKSINEQFFKNDPIE